MILREFKVWGGKREENDSLYIWAKDADDAIEIARLTDQSICISQWTGNEKSYEEAIKLVKEVAGMSLDWDDDHYEALQMAIKALEAMNQIYKTTGGNAETLYQSEITFDCVANILTDYFKEGEK